MKRQRARRAVVLGLLGLLGIGGGGAPAAAQAAGDPPVPLEVQSVDTSLPPRVVVTLTAPRAAAGTVVGPEHVTVMEDGIRRPVDVLHLPNDALEVVLVIDTS
ncbi:MAG TPA: hypothetical protein VM618_11290, partial [Acidimicrobiia bacterium]|nr:hypothetical protein [Acidimicrobiia bacterium]